MSRLAPTRKPQIDEGLCKRVDSIRHSFGDRISFNATLEVLIEQMLDLVEEDPSKRSVPPIAVALDAMRKPVLLPNLEKAERLADALLAAALRKSPGK